MPAAIGSRSAERLPAGCVGSSSLALQIQARSFASLTPLGQPVGGLFPLASARRALWLWLFVREFES